MELIRVQDSDYSKTYALYNTFPKEENGYVTKGLEMVLQKAKGFGIKEAYLSVNKDNRASLKVQQKNGAYIHHENDNEIFTRIKLEE